MRRQASLFLPDQFQIEAVRFRHNPMQARLIPAHVTLVREDEVNDWEAFQAKLESLRPFEIKLSFGHPVREDNFVFLPIDEGHNAYQDFRRAVLCKEARSHTPHVTLIHPRNGICTDQIFADISASIVTPFQHTFREVMLIQQDASGVWQVRSSIGKPKE